MRLVNGDKKGYLLFAVMLLAINCAYGQQKDFSYLIKCFSHVTDSFDVEIKGIGKVFMHSADAGNIKQTGLTYFAIPSAKLSTPLKKLATLEANLQETRWKHNSTVVSYDELDSAGAAFVDLRLHLLVENIYEQVLVVCDGERVYEIDCFIDPYNNDTFNKIATAIKSRQCLQ